MLAKIEEVDDQGPSALLRKLIGFHLRLATARMMDDLRPTLAEFELRPVLYTIMELVRANPGIIQMTVGAELGIQRANLVPLINQLTNREIIRRTVPKHDKRAFSLFLTASGERLHQRVTEAVLAHEERVFGSLSVKEREQLIALLDRIGAERKGRG